jgi:hypothetical protein
MSDFFDDRALFYLEHQEDIDRWAALRNDAANAAVGWLESMQGAIEERISTLDPRPIWFAPHSFSGHGLRLPHWPVEDDDPAIGIVLAWYSGNGLTGAYAAKVKPYVGVWVTPSLPAAQAMGTALQMGGLSGKGWDRPTARWPAWHWVSVTERWWEKLDSEKDRLIGELTTLWSRASPFIEEQLTDT